MEEEMKDRTKGNLQTLLYANKKAPTKYYLVSA
jgi:hypothetical protein